MGREREGVAGSVVLRLQEEAAAALKRKPPHEAKLAGVLRALAPHSPAVRTIIADTAGALAKRAGFDRELWSGSIRTLTELSDKRAIPLLKTALAADDVGGLATLSAAGFVKDAAISPLLAKVAVGRTAHLAFAAEVARVARGESNGAFLQGLAPKIKESHRIALCLEVFVPLLRGPTLTPEVGAPLRVLRDAERHLGRWLVLAEIAHRAGDPQPLAEAKERATDGPATTRAAWSLVVWALAGGPPPPTRPTVELVSRLSDRPSADRDTTFLFRLAHAKSAAARPMLESVAKTAPFADEVAVRAAMHLARDHARGELRPALEETALNGKDELRGVACAALWDLGATDVARRAAEGLVESRVLSSLAWSALVLAAPTKPAPLLSEPNFRRLQWGWVE